MGENVSISMKKSEAMKVERRLQIRTPDYSQPSNFSVDRILLFQTVRFGFGGYDVFI